MFDGVTLADFWSEVGVWTLILGAPLSFILSYLPASRMRLILIWVWMLFPLNVTIILLPFAGFPVLLLMSLFLFLPPWFAVTGIAYCAGQGFQRLRGGDGYGR